MRGVGLGVAGAGRIEERQALEGALKSLYPRLALHVAPDSEAAHIGAFDNGDGVLVISGTGSIVWGRSGDIWHRAGGFGYLIGDEGSGMKIGMEGLSAAGLAWDGGPKTVLCDLLAERHGITDGASMVKAVYESGMQPSRFANDVLEAASMGDTVCHAICDRQSQLLASQVRIVSNKMPLQTNAVVLWGGLQKNELYHHMVMEAICALVEGAVFADPIHDPWVGAALMAKIRQQRVGSSAFM